MTEEKLAFYQSAFPVWEDLTPQQRDLLLSSTIEKTFPKGAALHQGGQDCSGLVIVYSGQLRGFIFSGSGKEITLYRLFDRDMCLFTASCLLKNIHFDIHVTAEKETQALPIPTGVYQQLMESSLAVADYTGQLMASRFSDVMWVMEQVLFASFDQRLAIFLEAQSNVDGSDTLHMTQEEIARHLGSAREVVTRMLKYFQAEGIVELFRGGLTIIDRKKLHRLAQPQNPS